MLRASRLMPLPFKPVKKSSGYHPPMLTSRLRSVRHHHSLLPTLLDLVLYHELAAYYRSYVSWVFQNSVLSELVT
jgi:hypothetical protein